MAKHSSNKVSDKSKLESLEIARGIKKPGQTKEQTKLIAQGISKGIVQYKARHKQKIREIDKKRNKQTNIDLSVSSASNEAIDNEKSKTNSLAWVLLVFSWTFFVLYIYFIQ